MFWPTGESSYWDSQVSHREYSWFVQTDSAYSVSNIARTVTTDLVHISSTVITADMAVRLETKASLENLRDILASLLPTSVAVFNNVVLELLQDGVEREFLVNKEFTRDNLVALVIDKSEKPRQKIILFCYPETNRNLKDFLQTNLNFKIPLLFGVSDEFFVTGPTVILYCRESHYSSKRWFSLCMVTAPQTGLQ